jgi:tRNA (uracil-5-)-methyltransferase TRM9
MNATTVQKLIEVNRTFYKDHADSFSSTRERLQPGVLSMVTNIPPGISILDLGCGNGEFLHHLEKIRFHGSYTGMDFSSELLDFAWGKNCEVKNISFNFIQTDLNTEKWSSNLPENSFGLVTCFATLHHFPGRETHLQFLHQIHRLLKPEGRFYISVWQFMNSERLAKRILPWETIGLSAVEVDPGDYLLDWRADNMTTQTGQRYVHLFSETELSDLAQEAGFSVISQFFSDGRNGNLALYQEWEKTTN